MVPVGTPECVLVTDALSTTVCPTVEMVGETASTVEEAAAAAGFTVALTVAEVEGLKLLSPEYCAVME